MKKQLKQHHVITKTIWHCLVGIAEYLGVPFLLAYLSAFLSPICGEFHIWQWIERVAFCFTIYEIVLVGIRKMMIDVRKDALLALKTAYERAILYCESGNEFISAKLVEQVNKVLDTGVLNQLDVIQRYNDLLDYLQSKNVVAMKYEVLTLQHVIETDGLLWNYTLFLRLLKRGERN